MPNARELSEPAGSDSGGRSAGDAPPVLKRLLEGTGVHFNGGGPCDIEVRDARTYRQIIARGSLGFGEAYMDDWWNCDRLDEMFTRLLRVDVDKKLRAVPRLRLQLGIAANALADRLINKQSLRRAFKVGEHHYDVGNDVFEAMLDPTMSYSCGYWAHASDLDRAQRDKLDMICRKLELQPGDRLHDIGCGWGALAEHAARHFGAQVTGITVSRQQLQFARRRCAGLSVQLELMDYRSLNGRFDKIASVGMFEHVGPKNYRLFFDTARRLLADDGLFLLHTIGRDTGQGETDPWIEKYIFPNGKLPLARQIATAIEPRLQIRDWHEFGADYDRTLMAWWENFNRAWPSLRAAYGQRFYRMWKYYLHSCAGGFRAGQMQLWQLVLSPRGTRADYRSIRP
jgi:cyclopropane-fatty-acyl-phospholipid synthase